jgi:hypothetical protein
MYAYAECKAACRATHAVPYTTTDHCICTFILSTTGGRGIFYIESRPAQGVLLAKGMRESHKEWLEKSDLNGFLRKAQRSTRFKEMAIEKLCQVR